MSSHLPNQKSWDRFWSRNYRRPGRTISFSKQRIEKLLRSCHSPRHLVIDAGCGSGYFSKLFCDWGWDVAAVDYSPEALNVASEMTHGKVNTIQADLVKENLSDKFSGKQCSLIFSDGLLEHFERQDQDKILKNFHAVLEDAGQVLTVVPNRWSPWQMIRPFMMPGIYEMPFVLSHLKKLHEVNGFKVISSGGINVLPFRVSPEFLGPQFGMLLYVICKKISA